MQVFYNSRQARKWTYVAGLIMAPQGWPSQEKLTLHDLKSENAAAVGMKIIIIIVIYACCFQLSSLDMPE